MVKFDIFEAIREVELKLRKNITDPSNRLSSQTENFVGNNIETEFEMQNDLVSSKHTIKHIDYVKIDGITQTPWVDYNYYVDDVNAGKIIFITPPPDTSDIEVKYYYGTSSWIYTDFPAFTLKLSEYPRVAIDIVGGNSTVESIGADSLDSTFFVEIVVFAPTKRQVESIITEIRNWIIDNGKTFQSFRFITPKSISPYLVDPNRSERIFQRSLTLEIQMQEEV